MGGDRVYLVVQRKELQQSTIANLRARVEQPWHRGQQHEQPSHASKASRYTSRVARAALGLLYQRQVRVLGLVFNSVRPTAVDYYYYKYKDYYKTYPAPGPAAKQPVSA